MTAAPNTAQRQIGVALKEWSGICQAIANGAQTILLRKGGLGDTQGFQPEHPSFWLYPTRSHQAEQGLRASVAPLPLSGSVPIDIDTFVEVQSSTWLDSLEQVESLAPFHLWTDSSIRGRFHYRRAGLWLLIVRAHRVPEPHAYLERPEHSGCHSWVNLESSLSVSGHKPVLSECEFQARVGALCEALGIAALDSRAF